MREGRSLSRVRIVLIEVTPFAIGLYPMAWFVSRVGFDRSPSVLMLVLITSFLVWRARQAWRLSESLVEQDR